MGNLVEQLTDERVILLQDVQYFFFFYKLCNISLLSGW